MAKISGTDISNSKTLEEIVRFCAKLFREIRDIINGGIVFSDNFSAKIQDVSFTAANSETQVEHNLGRIPTGYLMLSATAAAILYSGAQAADEKFIYLKSSAITTAKVMVF